MIANEMPTTILEERAIIDSRARSLEIFASITIEAEVWRILYALSIPEYMEAWLHLPGTERVECHSERRSFDRFRIDMFSSNTKLSSIYGSCLLSKPNRITYIWDKNHGGDRSRSVVEIHLLGGYNCCALRLKHRGLTNQEDMEWHSTMWQYSLIKLQTLVTPIECGETCRERDGQA